MTGVQVPTSDANATDTEPVPFVMLMFEPAVRVPSVIALAEVPPMRKLSVCNRHVKLLFLSHAAFPKPLSFESTPRTINQEKRLRPTL